jgi:hypothetical protein
MGRTQANGAGMEQSTQTTWCVVRERVVRGSVYVRVCVRKRQQSEREREREEQHTTELNPNPNPNPICYLLCDGLRELRYFYLCYTVTWLTPKALVSRC